MSKLKPSPPPASKAQSQGSADSWAPEFERRWLGRFGLQKTTWKTGVKKHLEKLPFCDQPLASELLGFLFGKLPKSVEREGDGEDLAEAFGWVCFSFWQCGSAFPAFPEEYAAFLRDQLCKPTAKRDPSAQIVAGLILGESRGDGGRCGFNRLILENPAAIRESEERVHEGGFEFYLKAREKYREYESYLAESREFKKDWESLKRSFKRQVDGKAIIRRSLLPERNWVKGEGAAFKKAGQRFQAAFDLFCWKYYLWGMAGEKPLLLKTSVVFTPFGTQLFIPGYLSFDSKRDLDHTKIAKLHRARGIPRQGPGFSVGRQELEELKKKAKLADRKARSNRLKGEARYEFVCKEIGFVDSGDYRRLRKLLQKRVN